MDLATIYENIAAQGSMFWAATGSVALGGTLILIAAFAQLKRLRSRSISPVESASHPEYRKTPVKSPEMKAVPEKSVTRDVKSPVWENGAETAKTGELRELAVRLRTAADKLEEFHRNTPQTPSLVEESALKESSSRVDYVFRAGLG